MNNLYHCAELNKNINIFHSINRFRESIGAKKLSCVFAMETWHKLEL